MSFRDDATAGAQNAGPMAREGGSAHPDGLQQGMLIGSRYRKERLLGKGGRGEVWLALDEELDDGVDVPVGDHVPIPERVAGEVGCVQRPAR